MEIKSFNINRSKEGMKEGLLDLRHIILRSLSLIKDNEEEQFYSVLATQLRILFCDNPGLIELYDEGIQLKQLSDFEEDNGIKFINPYNLFSDDKGKISLEKWKSQVLILVDGEMTFIKNIECKTCEYSNDTNLNNTMSLKATPKKTLLSFICDSCGKENNDIDISLLEIKGEKGEIPTHCVHRKEEFSIDQIIRGYANKQGGAHLDPKVNSAGLVSKYVGKDHLFNIGLYAVEVINQTLDKDQS